MADLFSPFTLKGVTLRNRIVMSPMTMYRSTDGRADDFHVMHMGARAAGGFGLLFPEQIAITPDGRTTTRCGGLYDDDQVEGWRRVCDLVSSMGGVNAIQLGHTGRKGSEVAPWEGGYQLPADHPDGWETRAPSAIPFGGDHDHPVHELSVEEIHALHRSYADAARRAVDAGFEWIEMHYAHGYLGASFFSPISNQRTDAYGGSLENRVRFHTEALDAVRAAIPERIPLTMRLGADDFNPTGATMDDAVAAIAMMKEHGLDLADISFGMNTTEMVDPVFGDEAGFVPRAMRVKEEVGIPVGVSWNLGRPQVADQVVRAGLDLVLLGRPALANPHWPVWAARELGHEAPFSLVPEDYGWWLENFRGHAPSIGWPEVVPAASAAGGGDVDSDLASAGVSAATDAVDVTQERAA
ncbi:oxidoreductase [Pseudokineococcus sp. 1T1Z-3]|uniref:oxidoreductase n=1 Tax=Pseudokineococcus sp. 1T1Z-3 TaxID=3132745 RepID=UPI0030A13C66